MGQGKTKRREVRALFGVLPESGGCFLGLDGEEVRRHRTGSLLVLVRSYVVVNVRVLRNSVRILLLYSYCEYDYYLLVNACYYARCYHYVAVR
jgi:hypothetical protein